MAKAFIRNYQPLTLNRIGAYLTIFLVAFGHFCVDVVVLCLWRCDCGVVLFALLHCDHRVTLSDIRV